MKLYLTSASDESVGIFPAHIVIQMNYEPSDEKDRENIRQKGKDFMEETVAEECIEARFEDECVECGTRLIERDEEGRQIERKCPDKNCISNESEWDDNKPGELTPTDKECINAINKKDNPDVIARYCPSHGTHIQDDNFEKVKE